PQHPNDGIHGCQQAHNYQPLAHRKPGPVTFAALAQRFASPECFYKTGPRSMAFAHKRTLEDFRAISKHRV
ncbi:hypothetical protein RZS08_01050, partial [Arthrospira platensis SPKY1]|nr:hypothetical protein [Arthrospira platensis SPKY1]